MRGWFRAAGAKGTILEPPSAANPNLAAQRGLFVKHEWERADLWDSATSEPTKDALANVSSAVRTRLVRLDVAASAAHEALQTLVGRGLDGAVLFPGEYGIARFVEDMARLDGLVEASIKETKTLFIAGK